MITEMGNKAEGICILGIDPGTRVTGYGIIKAFPARYEVLDFGVIRPKPSLPLHDRYLLIHNGIESILNQYSIDVVSIEDQFVSRNVKSALKLGMAKGICIIAAKKKGLLVHEYTPKTAKNAVVGTGSADKSQVQKMIKILLNLPQLPEPEDAADALALALCHAHHNRFEIIDDTP